MKKIISMALISAVIVSSCETKNDSTTVAGTDTTRTESTTTTTASAEMPDSATAMKNWMEYATPGDMHKMMASWVGTWNDSVTMWHTADASPEKSMLTTETKMMLDGRYQESKTTGTMMGMPFTGVSTLAYDKAKKEFIHTWIDNMGTGLMVLRGTWDESSKTLNLKGTMVDPSAGSAEEKDHRQVITVIDPNKQKFEMYGSGPDGKEFKTMEIVSTRK